MPTYYLRVEAVNLSHFVFDTHDISTIRGGSYILREAIEDLEKFRFQVPLKLITAAASQALFSFTADDEADGLLDEIQREVLTTLHRMTEGHGTFVVAVEPEIEGQFPLVLQKLEAQLRRKQWRRPTVAVPNLSVETETECFLDGWRPGSEPYYGDPDATGEKTSASTKMRRDRGRNIKHTLFVNLLQDSNYEDNLCSKDLELLAKHTGKGRLDGRIAFLYVDGNSFGEIRRKSCETPENRRKFDQTIQGARKNYLCKLLHLADNDEDFRTRDAKGKEALRLEVLLWGGDEMMLIVPAWKGWEVIDVFFDEMQSLNFNGMELSHRAAAVFCQHHTPILQVRKLADALLSCAKRDIGAQLNASTEAQNLRAAEYDALKRTRNSHRYCDAFHYLNLSSFDMLQGSLDHFIERYYKGVAYHDLLIPHSQLKPLWTHMQTIRQHVARSKVYDIIESIQQESATDEQKRIAVDRAIEQACALLTKADGLETQRAAGYLNARGVASWYFVADLWDYVRTWTPNESI